MFHVIKISLIIPELFLQHPNPFFFSVSIPLKACVTRHYLSTVWLGLILADQFKEFTTQVILSIYLKLNIIWSLFIHKILYLETNVGRTTCSMKIVEIYCLSGVHLNISEGSAQCMVGFGEG